MQRSQLYSVPSFTLRGPGRKLSHVWILLLLPRLGRLGLGGLSSRNIRQAGGGWFNVKKVLIELLLLLQLKLLAKSIELRLQLVFVKFLREK